MVVSNICYFHPYLREDFQFDKYFPNGLKPPTRSGLTDIQLSNLEWKNQGHRVAQRGSLGNWKVWTSEMFKDSLDLALYVCFILILVLTKMMHSEFRSIILYCTVLYIIYLAFCLQLVKTLNIFESNDNVVSEIRLREAFICGINTARWCPF